MLKPRIIPCLQLKNNGFVKTYKYSDPKYLGDPLNIVRIFNEKHVDELVITDIEATLKSREPNYELIEKLAAECRMPLCYVGGICNIQQIERLIGLGVEKIGLSTSAINTPSLISDAAERLGSQSIVVIIDVKREASTGEYGVYTHGGSKHRGLNPCDFAKEVELLGAGEIIVNSIDRDGVMGGYDFEILDKIRNSVSLPLTALGGAGSTADIHALFNRYKLIGAAASSIFVFRGKFKAVLIQYPQPEDKLNLYET